jgi:hypothetical protein
MQLTGIVSNICCVIFLHCKKRWKPLVFGSGGYRKAGLCAYSTLLSVFIPLFVFVLIFYKLLSFIIISGTMFINLHQVADGKVGNR